MISAPQKQMPILTAVLFCIMVIIVTQAYFLYRFQQKNSSLIHAMDLLEMSMQKEQEKNRIQYDSLQSQISLQTDLHKSLKKELSSLEKTRAEIKLQTDENKKAILRIRAVDSLRNAVARHYRR